MQDLKASQLAAVVGGKTDLSLQLTSLTTQIQSLANNNNNGGSSNMLLFAMLAMRSQPQVVAGPPSDMGMGMPQSGPIININTRIGRRR